MPTVQAAEFLRACARARLAVVVAGAPGSGKTTIMSCAAPELDPSLRVVAEEVFEADAPLPKCRVATKSAIECQRSIWSHLELSAITITPNSSAISRHESRADDELKV